LETDLDELHKQVIEGEALLKNILSILPEGIIILNKDVKASINFANF
jgi:hypothetical protein